MDDHSLACTVRTDGAAVTFPVRVGERLLHEMIRSGQKPIDVGCRGGGCGVCRIRVVEGDYATKPMSRKHISEADECEGLALACRVVPITPLVVERVPPTGTHPPRSR